MALPSASALALTGNAYTAFTKDVVYIVPTIASITVPTLAEFNAGKDVTRHIQSGGISGFDTAVAKLDLGRLGTNFMGNLGGRESANDSSIVFLASDAGPASDVRGLATLQQNATGYVVFFNEGIVTSGACDIWPYRIGAVSTSRDTEGIRIVTVMFNIPAAPSRNIAIPTA